MPGFLFIRSLVFAYLFLSVYGCTSPSFNNLTTQSNFNLSRFLGIWFEIEWLAGEPHNASDIWFNFYQSFQLKNSTTQELLVPGGARLQDNDTCFTVASWSILANDSGRMILENQGSDNSTALNWPYYVIQTDYDNYALIYGCSTNNYSYTEPCADPILWLFSRTTSLSDTYQANLTSIIENQLCVNQTDLEITPQNGTQCYSTPTTSLPTSTSTTSPSNSTPTRFLSNSILIVFLFFLYI